MGRMSGSSDGRGSAEQAPATPPIARVGTLGTDDGRRAGWRELLAHLAPLYPGGLLIALAVISAPLPGIDAWGHPSRQVFAWPDGLQLIK